MHAKILKEFMKKKKMDREDEGEMKLKKKLTKHLAKDDKEFRSQIADDVKMKKIIKKKLK